MTAPAFPALGIDEDWSKADARQLAAAGYRFIIGYVSEDATGKNITRDQVDAAHAAGLDIGLVYEYATTAATGGESRGIRDAGIAITHAEQLGAPLGTALYAAVDFNATAAQLPLVLAYATGFRNLAQLAGYRAGIYGSYAVCQYLAQNHYAGFLWQTYAWSGTPPQWWAGDAVRQTLNRINVAGATVDKDYALVTDWGQWEAVMAFLDDSNAAALAYRVDALSAGSDTVQGGPYGPHNGQQGEPMWLVQAVKNIQTKVAALAAPAAVDTHALATDIVQQLEATGVVTASGIHDIVKQVLDAKLAAAQAA